MVLQGLTKLLKRRKEEKVIRLSKLKFYCGKCSGLILDEKMAYDSNSGELYHEGVCSGWANQRKKARAKEKKPLYIDYISKKKAVELHNNGLLKDINEELNNQDFLNDIPLEDNLN